MKRSTAERLIAQSKRIISEIEQAIREIREGEFDTILHHLNTTREASIINAQRETEPRGGCYRGRHGEMRGRCTISLRSGYRSHYGKRRTH